MSLDSNSTVDALVKVGPEAVFAASLSRITHAAPHLPSARGSTESSLITTRLFKSSLIDPFPPFLRNFLFHSNPFSTDIACALFSSWPIGLDFHDSCSGFLNTPMSLKIERHVVSETIPLSIESSRSTGLGF